MDGSFAIVGMGCRLPGDVRSIPQFWDLLCSGRSTQSAVPKNRFSIENWYHPDSKRHGAVASSGGYFLSDGDDYCQFDPSFFGIHPLEAATMDPQQRKLLEVVYETFESAGVTLQAASGSKTACYVGAFTHDYVNICTRDAEEYPAFLSTGSDMTILSNRVNYTFNLQGPSFTIDTACSSSLYALHLACQSLRSGDCDAAVVAGTNIIMDVRHQIVATKLGILSPTATCRTFDESADGFGRAEGITALYVKRLTDAIRDGDPIRAVIRGSAIATNGKGQGISHPGLAGQEATIRHAYTQANLSFSDTGYFECHGTGTPVGDPIEVTAIGNCFATDRTPDKPLLLSAVKSQIGHTEGSSGIAGVQKAVLSLEHEMVPATVGIKRLNPALNLRGGRLKIVRHMEKWPAYHDYGRASVNSFGYGGANCHLIIDSTLSFFARHLPKYFPVTWTFREPVSNNHVSCNKQSNPTGQRGTLLVTSAHSQSSLQKNLTALNGTVNNYNPPDLAYTLALKRSHLHHRAFCVATTLSDGTVLTEWEMGAESAKVPTIAFVFTGQGAQWPRMGIELVETYQVVQEVFMKMQEHLDAIPERPPWTLVEALSAWPEHSLIMKDVTVSVTLCTAVQVALVELLRSWGLNPTAVTGHSSGEAAAAYCAGYLTLQETIVTSYYRALSLARNPQPGLMMAAGMSPIDAIELVAAREHLYLACQNSPESVTISGLPPAVTELERELKSKGVFARIVKSSGFANHSPLVSNAANYFLDHFSDSVASSKSLSTRIVRAPFYSCITGTCLERSDVGSKYWSDNIAAPVRFDEAVQSLLQNERSVDLLIELGPHSALAGPIRQIKARLGGSYAKSAYLSTITRGSNSVSDLLKLAGALFNMGYPIDLARVNKAALSSREVHIPRHIVDLPTYPWVYPIQPNIKFPRTANDIRFRKHARHDLLGSYEAASTPRTLIWRNKLNLAEVPWIKDHQIGNSVLFPASGYIGMSLEALRQQASNTGAQVSFYRFRDVTISKPLVLSDGVSVETIFEMNLSDAHDVGYQQFTFTISSISGDDQWTQFATGACAYIDADQSDKSFFENETPAAEGPTMTSYDLYADFKKAGLRYGPCFRTLSDMNIYHNNTAKGRINLRPTQHSMKYESEYKVHPATLDGCLQAAFAANKDVNDQTDNPRAFLPTVILSLSISAVLIPSSTDIGTIVSKVEEQSPHSIDASFHLADNHGIAFVQGIVRLVAADGIVTSKTKVKAMTEPYHRVEWATDIDYLNGSILGSDLSNTQSNPRIITRLQNQQCNGKVNGNGDISESAKSCNGFDIEHDVPMVNNSNDEDYSSHYETLSKLIALIAFKRPGIKYLELGSSIQSARAILNGVSAQLRYPFCSELTFIRHDESSLTTEFLTYPNANAKCIEKTTEEYGVVVLTGLPENLIDLSNLLAEYATLQPSNGQIILADPKISLITSLDQVKSALNNAGYTRMKFFMEDASILVAQLEGSTENAIASTGEAERLIIYKFETPWISRIIAAMRGAHPHVKAMQLSDFQSFPDGAHAIFLLEMEQPLLMQLTEDELTALQKILAVAGSVQWVYANQPGTALFPGMLKSLKVEMPHLRIKCIQIDNTSELKAQRNFELLQQILNPTSQSNLGNEEHIAIRDGKIMIMRYVLDESENLQDTGRSKGLIENGRLESNHRLIPQFSSKVYPFYFQEDEALRWSEMTSNKVRIEPITYSMNAENMSVLRGQSQGKWFSHACFGKVMEVGSGSSMLLGLWVLTLGGTLIDGEIITEDDFCVTCSSYNEGQALVTYAEALFNAYYALVEVGRVRKDDLVLMNTDDGHLIHVVTIIAKHLGVNVVEVRKQNGHQHVPGPFKSTVNGEKANSNGVSTSPRKPRYSIVIDTIGDLKLSPLATHFAPSCKVIYIGRTTTFKSSGVEVSSLKKSLSVSYLDTIELTTSEPHYTTEIFRKSIELAHESEILLNLPTPPNFDITELPQAVEALSSKDGPSHIALSFPHNVIVPIYRVMKSSFKLNSNGAYLLVGCLGGLGRSITTWMLAHGARHFIFLSRSGTDNPQAQNLITTLLQTPTVTAEVIRGDVTISSDVHAAVASSPVPIHGVIQAATIFHESSFKTMTLSDFNNVIRPKVHGTINLHDATLNQPLDFFVTTSSAIGITGAITQTHYAAANAFQDAFARYRRYELGLPACSLVLGMVVGIGHVHDSNLEDVLAKRGGYGINEAEFLRMMEIACSNGTVTTTTTGLDTSSLITSLDPVKLFSDPSTFILANRDPSLIHLGHNLSRLAPELASTTTTSSSSSTYTNTSLSLLSSTPNKLSDEELTTKIQTSLITKFSQLTLTPPEELEAKIYKPLSDLGLDSIIAAELQSWVLREGRVDVDFMEMLGGGMSLGRLGELVKEKVVGG